MIDIETMAQGPNAAILSIAGVRFDLETGQTGAWMHEPVSLASSQEYGLEIDASTVLFWLDQSKEAQRGWRVEHPKLLPSALNVLTHLVNVEGGTSWVWANSPSFDCVILANAYKVTKQQKPWSFRAERDVRTLIQLGRDVGFDAKAAPRTGVAHDALADCHEQIAQCHRAWQHLTR